MPYGRGHIKVLDVLDGRKENIHSSCRAALIIFYIGGLHEDPWSRFGPVWCALFSYDDNHKLQYCLTRNENASSPCHWPNTTRESSTSAPGLSTPGYLHDIYRLSPFYTPRDVPMTGLRLTADVPSSLTLTPALRNDVAGDPGGVYYGSAA